MKTIRVVTKQAGMLNIPQVQDVENSTAAKQKLVCPRGEGAVFARAYDPALEIRNIDLYFNESYLFDSGCTGNFQAGGNMLQGPVFFIGHDGEGGSIGLDADQIAFIREFIDNSIQQIC